MNSPPPHPLGRHFVRVAGREWHYTVSGSGPPLLALHRAPLTARSLADLSLRNRNFTLLAPDLPGYGGTDTLAESSTIDDYARAVADLLSVLRCPPLPIIGDREGALVALALAGNFPQQALAVGAVGLRVEHDQHFVDLEPRADGAHLAALWGYLREDSVFAPAGARTLEQRMLRALPPPAVLHERVVEVLRAREQGRLFDRLLRAAARDRANLDARLSRVRCALLLTGAVDERDERAIADAGSIVAPKQRVEFAADRAGALDIALAFAWEAVCEAAGNQLNTCALQAASKSDDAATSGALTRAYVGIAGAQIHYLSNDDAATIPLLVQHDAASSVGTVRPIVEAFVGRRSVYAFDLPGSGDSDDTLSSDPVAVAEYAARLLAALVELGIERFDFYGMWGGGFVGLELARLAPSRVRRLVLSNVFFHEGAERERFQQHYTPLVEPIWHGGHLLQAWHQMRDQGLFYPWFDCSAAGVIRREPFLDTGMVHERVCSLLKAGARYRSAYQAHFIYPTLERLRTVQVPTLLATSGWDPNRPHTERAAELNPHCRFLILHPDFRKWGESFLDYLEEPE